MSFCLLNLIGKWIGILFVLLTSSLGYKIENESNQIAYNFDNMAMNVEFDVEEYKTIKKYNYKKPYGTTKVLSEGLASVSYISNGEKIVLHELQNEIVEVGTGAEGNYKGSITGYGADCVGCSGIVSCRTEKNRAFDLRLEQNYNDSEYGEVRILAADLSLFKCGTVIQVTPTNGKSFVGVVLDTGIAMRNAWRGKGNILLDVALKSESDYGLYDITDKSGNVELNVKRWGW